MATISELNHGDVVVSEGDELWVITEFFSGGEIFRCQGFGRDEMMEDRIEFLKPDPQKRPRHWIHEQPEDPEDENPND
jgi:hypothetical protein